MATTIDKRVGDLYGDLTDIERARLLAKFYRENKPAEADRLRRSIPTDSAGEAYNRALAILGGLNGARLLGGLENLTTGFELDGFALVAAYQKAVAPFLTRGTIAKATRLLSYPITPEEYEALRQLQLDTLKTLDDDLIVDLLDTANPKKVATHNPALAEITAEWNRAEDEEEAFWDDLMARTLDLIRGAIEAGDLPRATDGEGRPAVPAGALAAWVDGKRPEEIEPYPPSMYVPAIEMLASFSLDWEISQAGAEAVAARRREIVETLGSILVEEKLLTAEQLAAMSPDPILDPDELEAASTAMETFWPWRVRADDYRLLVDSAARFAQRQAERRAYLDVLREIEEEVFGGENPLDPEVDTFLQRVEEQEARTAGIWEQIVEGLAGRMEMAGHDWPPAPETSGFYDAMHDTLRKLLIEAPVRG